MKAVSVPERAPTLDERVIAASEQLTVTEQQVVRYFVDHRDEVAFLSAANIAAALEISDATVIRAAQTLGYAGLPELKRELREAMRPRVNPAARYRRSLDELGEDSGELLDHVIAEQIELLSEARGSVDPQEFRHALGLLRGAKRIVILGVGPHGPLVDYFAQTVRRFGRQALPIAARGSGLADALIEIDAGDVLVVLAYERPSPEIEVALDYAAARAVPCILITDTLAHVFKGRYAVVLSARRGGSNVAATITVAVVIVEALLFGIAGQNRARTMAALEELTTLRDKLGIM